MNILFYTHGKVCATRGGTERTTVSVATAMTHYYGYRCFSLYEADENTEKEACFVSEFQWQAGPDKKQDVEKLRKIITDNGIDFIIDQGIFINVKLLRQAVENTSCKIILAHHYAPGAEVFYMTLKRHWEKRREKMPLRRRCKWFLDLALYPYAKYKYTAILRSTYREAYFMADCTVLLSRGFVDAYKKFGRFKDDSKFFIIPNSLSFTEFLPVEALETKQPVVLIVSRIEEVHKRLSLALKIWKQVKQHIEAKGWVLKIVGTGKDLPMYQSMIEREHIDAVIFEGHHNPLPYYREASVFLMTSRSESWGLTLTEAQQMGVVPIAFDSYASLRDIITDNEDGIIVPEGDIEQYVIKLLELMTDAPKRQMMATKALVNCRRFSQEQVVKQWIKLLEKLS